MTSDTEQCFFYRLAFSLLLNFPNCLTNDWWLCELFDLINDNWKLKTTLFYLCVPTNSFLTLCSYWRLQFGNQWLLITTTSVWRNLNCVNQSELFEPIWTVWSDQCVFTTQFGIWSNQWKLIWWYKQLFSDLTASLWETSRLKTSDNQLTMDMTLAAKRGLQV